MDVPDNDMAENRDEDKDERQPGRERLSLESALGRSRAVKTKVAHAPVPCCDCQRRHWEWPAKRNISVD